MFDAQAEATQMARCGVNRGRTPEAEGSPGLRASRQGDPTYPCHQRAPSLPTDMTDVPGLSAPGECSAPAWGSASSLRSWAFPFTQSCQLVAPPWRPIISLAGQGYMTQHYCPLALPPTPACSDTCPGDSGSPTCQLHLGTRQLLCGDLEREEGGGPA